jgi:uncharacterized protein with NRDE domain
MCVVALAWRPGTLGALGARAGLELVVMGNRDELHDRPADALGVLDDAGQLLGGRDRVRGGGWLWAASSGRLATVTNVRVGGAAPQDDARSRGELVASFARGHASAAAFLDQLGARAAQYGRFNLLVCDGDELGYASNTPRFAARLLPAGVYAVSNGALDAPWPKVRRLRAALTAWLMHAPGAEGAERADVDVAPLLAALRDERGADDAELPDTGVGLQLERQLAPPFVRSLRYGTRCSSVVLYTAAELTFVERRYTPAGDVSGETALTVPRPRR